ncbi:MAG: hypothetical protein WC483_07065 [Candidatus Paceibacterota bacterium]
MNTRVLIAVAIIGAIILLAVIVGIVYFTRRGMYSDTELTKTIRLAYAERGQNPDDLVVEKIVEVKTEGEDGRSVYDIRISFLGGENEGKVFSFRYYFIVVAGETEEEEKKLIVENVTSAPLNSDARTE